MGKKLLAIVTFIVCLLMAFTSCSTTEPLTDDNSATTYSVGGFLAETGDYVYFINGSELYSEDNTSGNVEKGSLVRVKKADLDKGSSAKAECVVSKLISTSDYAAGIAIADGRIYYATPSTEKDKLGNVKNTDIEFYSAKLNGTDVKKIATASGSAGNAAAYRFYYDETVNKTYVLFVSEETVTEDGSEVTKKYLNVVAADGSEVFKTEYETYVFDKDGGAYVYYTTNVKNEELNSTESFNAVYRVKIGATESEMMLYGAGSNRNEQDGKTYVNKGIQGVKFTLVAAQNNYLYLSVATVDTTVAATTFYAYVGETIDADAEKNYAENLKVMTYDSTSAATVLTASAVYFDPQNVMYMDSSKGICSYNYANESDYDKYFGITVEYYDKDILSGTIAYVNNGYLYVNVSGVYYRLKMQANTIAQDAVTEKISPLTYSTSWYAPEVVTVGDKEYVIGMYSAADYKDRVFATAIEDFEKEIITKDADEVYFITEANVKAFIEAFVTDEEDVNDFINDNKETTLASFMTASSRLSVNYMWTKTISLIGAEAQKEIDEYLEDTYPESSSSSSSSSIESESCSSAVASSAIAAVVLLGGFTVAVAKKRD